jgi:aminoglycoside phosphotransferase
MTEDIVNTICLQAFNALPSSVQRNHVGIAAYVYTLEISGIKYVLKISETKELIRGSIYWLNRLQSLELPIPKIHSLNVKTSPYYCVMTYIPGNDLGLVYNTLSNDQKRAIACDIYHYQNVLRSLPAANGYGFLHSYDDLNNLKGNWKEVVENHITRSERRITQNNIFSIDYVNRVKSFISFFCDYFDTIKAEPFFDDATTKNVLIDQGNLSGIIDLDWICFGDRLYVIALTSMSLLNMQTDLEYVEYWKKLETLSDIQEKVLLFYILIFCIDFMSEKGIRFNKEEEVKVTNAEKKLLQSIFEEYCNKLQLTTAST